MLQEIANATDQRIVNALRSKDLQSERWVNDDPSLQAILEWIRDHV